MIKAQKYSWLNDYIGLPYQLNGRGVSGVDCYGLLCLVFRDRLGVDLPDWRAADGSAKAAITILQKQIENERVGGNAREIFAPVDWSVVTVHRAARAHHIGLAMRCGVLHSDHAYGAEWCPLDRFKTQYPFKLRFWQWQV